MSRESHELQGRILACEMMQARILNLLATAYEPESPLAMLDLFERETMAGLQHIEVDIGPEADIVWESAGDSLRLRFEIARGILQSGISTSDTRRLSADTSDTYDRGTI